MKKTIVANWKMCGSPETAKTWVHDFLSSFSGSNNQVVVCPPDALIVLLKSLVSHSTIKLGGQDCHVKVEGAFTGETSAKLLKEVGCEYVIVGHSERRSYAGETNQIVNEKATQAINCDLIPIICIGETGEERDSGATLAVIRKQLQESLPNSGDFILAYEPVWAIGSGRVPSIDEIQQVHEAIINQVSKDRGLDINRVSVLYGGSVKPENAKEILALPEVAGVLVGGASLKAGDFFKIVTSVSAL